MNPKDQSSRKGQSLVLVALLLVVLIGMLAVVLDGGYAYLQRRTAQTAADAGALAGATVLCQTGSSDLAIESALEYAKERNKATYAYATVDMDTRIVTVDTEIPFSTFFGSILNRPQITAAAIAEAGCFPPGNAERVLPIAWSCRPLLGSFDPDFDLDPDNPESCDYQLNEKIYLIMNSNFTANDLLCQDPETFEPDLSANVLDCDWDNDGSNDALAGGDRSWLDLNGGAPSEKEIKDWINGGFPGEIEIHTWFPGADGARADAFINLEAKVGATYLVPVFDYYCPKGGLPEDNCPPPIYHDEDKTMDGGTSDIYFHVITFAAFHITCVDGPGKASPLCPAHEAAVDNGMKDNVFTIEGYFTNKFFDTAGGRGDVFAGVYVVSLIR